jgi:hypothetical protein
MHSAVFLSILGLIIKFKYAQASEQMATITNLAHMKGQFWLYFLCFRDIGDQ